MRHEAIRKISYSAMFIALGLVLPFLTGQIPEIGNMLLPMHLPVILAGFICGPVYGGVVGFIVPLLRSVMFSRPVMYPSAIAMAFELLTLAAVVGILYKISRHKCIYSLYRSLIAGIIASRAVWGVAMALLMLGGEASFTFSAFILGAFVDSFLGIIIELILVPIIMIALGKARLVPFRNLLPKDTGDAEKILDRIEQIKKEKGRVIVAIDGRSASGKTTLAQRLSRHTGANVFHIDDFFLPRDLRGDDFESNGGNIDKERLASELIAPLLSGEDFTYRKYSCKEERFTEVPVKRTDVSIVEGTYSTLPAFGKYYDLSIFIYISEEKQQKRLLAREGEERMNDFNTIWIPREERYFSECNTRENSDMQISVD